MENPRAFPSQIPTFDENTTIFFIIATEIGHRLRKYAKSKLANLNTLAVQILYLQTDLSHFCSLSVTIHTFYVLNKTINGFIRW